MTITHVDIKLKLKPDVKQNLTRSELKERDREKERKRVVELVSIILLICETATIMGLMRTRTLVY